MNPRILLAAIALPISAFAAPALLVEMTITEQPAAAEKRILAKPRVIVESGTKFSISVENLELVVIPTLLKDGTVDLNIVAAERFGKKQDLEKMPRVNARIGATAELEIGDLLLS